MNEYPPEVKLSKTQKNKNMDRRIGYVPIKIISSIGQNTVKPYTHIKATPFCTLRFIHINSYANN